MNNLPAKLNELVLTSSDVKKTFDKNYLDIIDKLYFDLPMRYKVDFIHKAQLTGANPALNQIYLTSYSSYDRLTKQYAKVGVVVFSYNFFLSQANQTGQFENHEINTCVEDVFNPITQETKKQLVSTAIVYRKGRHHVTAKARWDECYNDKNPIWKSKPYSMLEKCALSKALRWAFPETLSGMFIEEEIRNEYEEEKKIEFNDAIESTAKKIEKEKEIIEDVKDEIPKDEIIKAISEISAKLCQKFSNVQQKADWMNKHLKVNSFKVMNQKTKKELREILEAIKELN